MSNKKGINEAIDAAKAIINSTLYIPDSLKPKKKKKKKSDGGTN